MRAFNASLVPRPELTLPPLPPTLDLEIGAGQGLHAVSYCAQNPERTLIAVEKTHTRFHQLQRRHQAHLHLTNLLPVHADAAAFVTHHLPENSLERIFLLYPNPYPKAKQSNLRWHNRPFFQLLLTRLKPGGELTLATNLEWYAEEAQRQLCDHWHLQSLEYRPYQQQPRTHFEKKYLARGERCWNLLLRKIQ